MHVEKQPFQEIDGILAKKNLSRVNVFVMETILWGVFYVSSANKTPEIK